MKKPILLLGIAAIFPVASGFAQRPGGPPPGPPPQGQQDNQRPQRQPRDRNDQPPPVPPLIAALDTDHDEIISAEEIKNAPQSLRKLDKNNDGKLTQDELFPRPPQGDRQHDRGNRERKGPSDQNKDTTVPAAKPEAGNPPKPGDRERRPDNNQRKPEGQQGDQQHPPVPPLMEALDANHDGIISADEIANASAALLKLDKNGDGQLGPAEYRGHPPGPQGPPPPPDADTRPAGDPPPLGK